METAAIIASVVSVIIGVFAIWLSVTFYKMSTQISESIKEAAKNISSGVERLEKLFDRLYSDTFGIMKETVSDMRKHIWPEEKKTEINFAEETEKKAEEKIKKLKEEIQEELQNSLHRQKLTDEKINLLSGEMSKLLDKTIISSRNVYKEAKIEALEDYILDYLKQAEYDDRDAKAIEIVEDMEKKGFDSNLVVYRLEELKREGVVTWKEGLLQPFSNVRLLQKQNIKN